MAPGISVSFEFSLIYPNKTLTTLFSQKVGLGPDSQFQNIQPIYLSISVYTALHRSNTFTVVYFSHNVGSLHLGSICNIYTLFYSLTE